MRDLSLEEYCEEVETLLKDTKPASADSNMSVATIRLNREVLVTDAAGRSEEAGRNKAGGSRLRRSRGQRPPPQQH